MTSIIPNTSLAGSPTADAAQTRPLPVLDTADIPNLDAIVTEDGAPVDNFFVEKQYRLLTDPLYSTWAATLEGRSFLVATDVGFFHTYKQPPLMPDCMLSLGVTPGAGLRAKENRSYFLWMVGKPPDLVIEIVSDRRGGEDSLKKSEYALWGILFYVIFDPDNLLGGGVLRAGVNHRRKFEPIDPSWFPEVGLGLKLWQGAFEGCRETWLRWCDKDGQVISTGAERADRLAAQLRALGQAPEV
jgi:hypothetical protein